MKNSRDFILDGIGLKYLGNEHDFLNAYEELCIATLNKQGLEEIQVQISCNQIEVSAYLGNTLLSLECEGVPKSFFCDGETFRTSLVQCILVIGNVKGTDACSALTNYYTKLGFENILLTENNVYTEYGLETSICGTVEKII